MLSIYPARWGTVPSVDDSRTFSMRKADWKDKRQQRVCFTSGCVSSNAALPLTATMSKSVCPSWELIIKYADSRQEYAGDLNARCATV